MRAGRWRGYTDRRTVQRTWGAVFSRVSIGVGVCYRAIDSGSCMIEHSRIDRLDFFYVRGPLRDRCRNLQNFHLPPSRFDQPPVIGAPPDASEERQLPLSLADDQPRGAHGGQAERLNELAAGR